jgi:predicted aldo/keto reductase-like oxidoreductase
MDTIRLGRTGLIVSRSGFGALPIQRISFEESKKILRKAYENGINFFDTARGYTDSEEKIGYALGSVRKDIIIATKSPAKTKEGLFSNVKESLKNLKTDYIDIMQFHNPSFVPKPGDELFDAMLSLKENGTVRFIGITNHGLDRALEAARSGLYDTIQFPLSALSSENELKLIDECKKYDLGLIAMKALSGGLIRNVPAAFAFLRQYDNLVPIWGIQRESELDQFLALEKAPPALDEKMWEAIELERKELASNFCRGCGYCLPCPAKIPIPTAARMSLLMTRSPVEPFITKEWKENMDRISDCINCGHCKNHCPYGLDTPALLKAAQKWYKDFCKQFTQ